jgi:hypothetical protein
MSTFKVYSRKIYVWHKCTPKTAPHLVWSFAWNTNAYRTCADAVAAAQAQYPGETFKASFTW